MRLNTGTKLQKYLLKKKVYVAKYNTRITLFNILLNII